MLTRLFTDSRCVPRCVTNSKGRKRRPGSKTLSQALRCNDSLFIDFVSKCLEWVWSFSWQLSRTISNVSFHHFSILSLLDGIPRSEWRPMKLAAMNGFSQTARRQRSLLLRHQHPRWRSTVAIRWRKMITIMHQSSRSFNDLSQLHHWRFCHRLRHHRIMLVRTTTTTTAPKTATRWKVSEIKICKEFHSSLQSSIVSHSQS